MVETRQQHRAREPAEQKATRRPDPNLPERVYEIELFRSLPDPSDPEDGAPGWSGECGLQDNSTGYDLDWSEDLQEVVNQAVDCARDYSNRYVLTLQ